MTYSSRRPRLRLPRNELYVPTVLMTAQISTAVSAPNPTANRAYYIPFSAPYDTAVKSIATGINSAAGNFDLGLYDAAGTRLGSLGSTSTNPGGVKVWTPSTPIGVAADTQYFAAAAYSSATAAYAGLATGAGRGVFLLMQDSAFALPSSWTTPTTNLTTGSGCPILRITFSN